jgi:hypothetical protein
MISSIAVDVAIDYTCISCASMDDEFLAAENKLGNLDTKLCGQFIEKE